MSSPRPAPLLLAGTALLLVLAGCAPRSGGVTLTDATRLRLTEAADRNNPAAPGTLTLIALRQQAADNPDSLAAHEALARSALAAGLPAEAAAALRRAVAIAGPQPDRLLALGRAEIRAGNAQGALDAYRQAQAAGRPDAAVFGGLGLAHDMNGNHAAAEEAHRRAVALAPQDWSLRGNLALSLLFAGRAAEGVRVLGSAESDTSAPRRARHNLALMLAADGQEARASRALRADMGPSEAAALMRDFQSFAQWVGASRPAPTRLLPSVETIPPAPAEQAAAAMPATAAPIPPMRGAPALAYVAPVVAAPPPMVSFAPAVAPPPSGSRAAGIPPMPGFGTPPMPQFDPLPSNDAPAAPRDGAITTTPLGNPGERAAPPEPTRAGVDGTATRDRAARTGTRFGPNSSRPTRRATSAR